MGCVFGCLIYGDVECWVWLIVIGEKGFIIFVDVLFDS